MIHEEFEQKRIEILGRQNPESTLTLLPRLLYHSCLLPHFPPRRHRHLYPFPKLLEAISFACSPHHRAWESYPSYFQLQGKS